MRQIVSPLSGIRSPFGLRDSVADFYAVAGLSPSLVFDFSSEFYRTGGSTTTFDAAMTHTRSGNATMVDSDGVLKWAPHNLALNSATPATQSITVVSGADYTVECTGVSIALSGAGTGTVTAGNPVTITASTTTLALTVTGSTGTMWAYRSDPGGMVDNPDTGNSYVPTTSAARYLPRRGHHIYNGSAWVNEGVLVESEARTNYLLNSGTVEPKEVYVTDQEYTVSFNSGSQFRSEIMETLAVTAVDVFVYDTSKDSDGGAWRTGALAQATSWYNETLDTATRGARREFPAVAVIVAEAAKVTIYDGDDPSLPMWMVFNLGSANGFWASTATATSLSMRDATLAVGSNAVGHRQVNFVSEKFVRSFTSSIGGQTGGIVNRNATLVAGPSDGPIIVNSTINDVAMTVLDDAPIDPATGLPVPTIAVATDGGVSVIKDDGTVTDSATTLGSSYVIFDNAYGIYYRRNITTGVFWYASQEDYEAGDGFGDEVARPTAGTNDFDLLTFGSLSLSGDGFAMGGDVSTNEAKLGLSKYAPNTLDFTKGMSALITSTYNTGWMNGDIKGAFLSDTDDTDLVGGTDADRSVNGNDLTVNGTVTRSPVATGADLVAYSGFSASNYLEQPYNSDLDFGTGDFCVMGWVDLNNDSFSTIFHKGLSNAAFGLKLETYLGASNYTPRVYVGVTPIVADSQFPAAGWFLATVLRRSGVVEIWANGQIIKSVANSSNVESEAGQKFRLGNRHSDQQQTMEGSLALWRISATAPTAEQIAKIYNDEKVLFQENAQATLYGASDAVTALAHDPDTGLLHVGTSAGRSVFDGHRRIDNTTDAITTAISAVGGFIAEE